MRSINIPTRALFGLRSILALSLLVAPASLLAAVPSSAAEQKPTLRQEAAALVAGGVPGIVVLSDAPGRRTRIAAGIDLATPRRPMLSGDRFRVGSITKTFVAALVLRLAEQRRLTLDDSVEHWLPRLVPNGESITVRHLLQHTSGLFDYAADPATFAPFATDPSHAWQPRELVAIATKHAPAFEPGTGWGYSNTNYVLLGLIGEAATGNTIGAEFERRIFRPLHLWATTFDRDGRLPRPVGRAPHRALRARVLHDRWPDVR
jgi:D-alanyl-D-alanine carboxypeptidase